MVEILKCNELILRIALKYLFT